jgi:hypothetical protein
MKIYNVKSSLIEKALMAFMFVIYISEVIANCHHLNRYFFAFKPLISPFDFNLIFNYFKVRNTLLF